MNYYSLHKKSPEVSFREAVVRGIAPDRGLYFPDRILPLPDSFFANLGDFTNQEIAFEAIKTFVGDAIPKNILKDILADVLDFDFPLVELEDNIASLELFHGPTMAFKDVGARFMARCLGYFSEGSAAEITVLVATSGDTGGAVANGFLGVPGVKVVILYPAGKVSAIQERQLTTLGQNISALEVAGTFDDCQHMVKTAFLDADIREQRTLTSANSINIARWLPQMFYYLFAYKQLNGSAKDCIFSVPSGNFGNLCAGMVARRLGLPVRHFIASTNINDTVPKFLESGQYKPKASKATISNAMDVGDPSNFERIRHLYGDNFEALAENLTSYSFTDIATKEAIAHLFREFGYIADPHGAVGYLGLKKYLESHPGEYGIFLETAHPIKFRDVVEAAIHRTLEMPEQIKKVMSGTKKTWPVSSYEGLKSFLLSDEKI